jgi:hypothetical protein
MGTWLAIGVALGTGIGAATDNVAVGIAIGTGLAPRSAPGSEASPRGEE